LDNSMWDFPRMEVVDGSTNREASTAAVS
jgi:hypothetical protein